MVCRAMLVTAVAMLSGCLRVQVPLNVVLWTVVIVVERFTLLLW